MLLESIEILFAALIFRAIFVVGSVHDKMDVEMWFICVNSGENLIIVFIILKCSLFDADSIVNSDGIFRRKAQDRVPKMGSLFVVVGIGYTLH